MHVQLPNRVHAEAGYAFHRGPLGPDADLVCMTGMHVAAVSRSDFVP
jgi:hypothetical protein